MFGNYGTCPINQSSYQLMGAEEPVSSSDSSSFIVPISDDRKNHLMTLNRGPLISYFSKKGGEIESDFMAYALTSKHFYEQIFPYSVTAVSRAQKWHFIPIKIISALSISIIFLNGFSLHNKFQENNGTEIVWLSQIISFIVPSMNLVNYSKLKTSLGHFDSLAVRQKLARLLFINFIAYMTITGTFPAPEYLRKRKSVKYDAIVLFLFLINTGLLIARYRCSKTRLIKMMCAPAATPRKKKSLCQRITTCFSASFRRCFQKCQGSSANPRLLNQDAS